MYRRATPLLYLLLTLVLDTGTTAQTITGRISGTITDSNRAAIPGATVKVTNTATRNERTAMSDPNGFYVVTNLPVGDYNVTVEVKDFKKAIKTGYSLVADGRLTVDFSLEPGQVMEVVEVNAATGETVNSTSGELARVIDQAQVQELALNGRNYMQLTTLIPGAPMLNDDQLALMTNLSVSQPINGNRGNSNLLSIDGGFNLDSGSNGSQINNVGIDFIREVAVKSSNFSAEYGRNSGASINVVTRSGGNKINGSVFEFLRNDKLDANNFFNNTRGVERPALRYNNFGFSLGGPIIKDKFFFFAGMEWKYIRRMTTPVLRTIPTQAELNGDFSYRLRGGDGIIGTEDDGVLRNPANPASSCTARTTTNGVVTPAVRTGCFPNNTIPANLITADGRAIASVYSAMAREAASYTDTPTGNNALFQEPNPFNYRQEIVRLDYRFNEHHSIFGRYLHDNYDLVDPFGTFINSQLPTIPTNRVRPGYGIQIGHMWMISPSVINEFKVNGSWNGQRVPPIGDAWKRSTYGFAYPQLFGGGGRFEEGIPDTTVGGFSSFRGPGASLLSPTTDIAFIDNISIQRASHSFKTGLLMVRNRKDQNGQSIYTGSVNFNSSGNPNSTSNSFADALLGNYRTYSEAAIDPIGFFRFTQFEAYATDNWRIKRRLSIEIGLRYAYALPTYTQANNLVLFDPSRYDPAQAVTVLPNGTIDLSKGGNRYNGLVRAGAGVPESELDRVTNGNSESVLSVPSGAPRGAYRSQHLIMPRFSFAYAPNNDGKTAIRGGFGIFYDRPEGNIIFSSANIPPYTESSQFENGNLTDIRGGKLSAAAPFANISTIDPNMELPYVMNYSFSVQHELPGGIFGEISYVGNQARHLLRQPDINQASFASLLANSRIQPSSARASTNSLRPYKGFAEIRMRMSDSVSNYNSLQIYASKRKGKLSMTVSYTWSKSLADSSTNDANPEDPFNRLFNYGPTDFDRRHILVSTYTYRLPSFPKSRAFLNKTLGGWELSGITRWQTGAYLTPTGTSSTGSRRADATGEPVAGSRTIDEWFNTAAFTRPPDERRGTAGVGVIGGPGRYLWDISLRKWFAIRERFKLQFQGDFFNAWEFVNLNNPNTDSNNNAYGRIDGAAPGRNIQIGLKLTF